jgi:hypothetical protein
MLCILLVGLWTGNVRWTRRPPRVTARGVTVSFLAVLAFALVSYYLF